MSDHSVVPMRTDVAGAHERRHLVEASAIGFGVDGSNPVATWAEIDRPYPRMVYKP